MSPPGASTSAERLLRLLVEQMDDFALFLLTPEGIVSDWFPGAQHIFGFEAGEIVGQHGRVLFEEDDRARGVPEHEFETARATGRAPDDRWHLRRDGSRIWASGFLFALRNEDGSLAGFAKVVRNRTDIKTMVEALENRLRGLEDEQERTRVFLGSLGHEMRNPLAPLTTAVHLLRRRGAGSADADVLRIIERQVSLLTRLADDLMDTVRIGAGKIDLQLKVVDLVEVFRAAADAIRERARERGLEFDVLSIRPPVPVLGDAQRLQQVFSNLLSNAVKYTPSGGRIAATLTVEGTDAMVNIEDTGIGMSADVLPRVFDLFTQEESSREMSGGGVGLGLALVRDLVELHGGSVQARSDGRDKGSVFTVRLPRHEEK